MSVNVLKEKWIAVSGSIFTEREFTGRGPGGNSYKFHPAVAFNVGDDVAKHIVRTHNEELTK